jgi:uncharacterized OB-fold protein
MSTDTQTDGKAAVEPREGRQTEDDRNREAWKAQCRECNELVPAKPYCYECGAERPADGDYYVAEEGGGR